MLVSEETMSSCDQANAHRQQSYEARDASRDDPLKVLWGCCDAMDQAKTMTPNLMQLSV